MSLIAWLPFGAAYLLGAMSQGPSFVIFIRNTMIGSRFHGIGSYALFSFTGMFILIKEGHRLSRPFLGRSRLPDLSGLEENHFQVGHCGKTSQETGF